MRKKLLAVILTMALSASLFVGCGNKAGDQAATTDEEVVDAGEDMSVKDETGDSSDESADDGLDQLEAIGDVDVDKGLFNVTITVPADFVGETTQEKLDESVKEKGYKSATLNDDGSVTYVMTKAQHEEMLAGIRESIDQALEEMVASENYPNITNVEANENYTSFTITTKNAEPDLSESFSVIALYTYGGMYGIFAGEEVDNVHVDFVNADSGEIISSANSKDMGDSD